MFETRLTISNPSSLQKELTLEDFLQKRKQIRESTMGDIGLTE